jgi:hypothetical protein
MTTISVSHFTPDQWLVTVEKPGWRVKFIQYCAWEGRSPTPLSICMSLMLLSKDNPVAKELARCMSKESLLVDTPIGDGKCYGGNLSVKAERIKTVAIGTEGHAQGTGRYTYTRPADIDS